MLGIEAQNTDSHWKSETIQQLLGEVADAVQDIHWVTCALSCFMMLLLFGFTAIKTRLRQQISDNSSDEQGCATRQQMTVSAHLEHVQWPGDGGCTFGAS